MKPFTIKTVNYQAPTVSAPNLSQVQAQQLAYNDLKQFVYESTCSENQVVLRNLRKKTYITKISLGGWHRWDRGGAGQASYHRVYLEYRFKSPALVQNYVYEVRVSANEDGQLDYQEHDSTYDFNPPIIIDDPNAELRIVTETIVESGQQCTTTFLIFGYEDTRT